MSPAQAHHQDPESSLRNAVRDAFLNIPLPDGVLPDVDGSDCDDTDSHDSQHQTLSDNATTCPAGLVEEVLWGLFHGLTAPVTGDVPGYSGSTGATVTTGPSGAPHA